jgi:hypothetical protein
MRFLYQGARPLSTKHDIPEIKTFNRNLNPSNFNELEFPKDTTESRSVSSNVARPSLIGADSQKLRSKAQFSRRYDRKLKTSELDQSRLAFQHRLS